MLMKTSLNLTKLSALGKEGLGAEGSPQVSPGCHLGALQQDLVGMHCDFLKSGGKINQSNQQAHPPPEVHMNKAYCYRTFAQAVNSSPQKQGHGTTKAAELGGQEGLMLQGGPESDISAPWT